MRPCCELLAKQRCRQTAPLDKLWTEEEVATAETMDNASLVLHVYNVSYCINFTVIGSYLLCPLFTVSTTYVTLNKSAGHLRIDHMTAL